MRKNLIFLLSLLSFLIIPIYDAHADNPNLFVSAENSKFDNHFSGSMVVEVVIRDSSISDTDEGKGEPDVTLNGKSLRMVQATDGNWYAYFANVGKAKIADSTVGQPGKGLDFGVFCGRDTSTSILGIDISETDGVAIPGPSNTLVGFTNGAVSFSSCTGTIDSTVDDQNNVVRKAKSINTNAPLDGQIGLKPDAWPLIQLYSFDDVTIQYNPGGGVQQVDLEYDDIPNIALEIDRNNYPQNSEVFVSINDAQLNQDPTDEDSWTFNVGSPNAVFYQAFDNNGNNDANGSAGLVNLRPFLSSLGFNENGILSLDKGNVVELTTNSEQETSEVTNGSTFSEIITIVEEGPYSGLFDTSDHNDKSTIKIRGDAPRGETGTISYNDQSISILSGFSTASVSFDEPTLTIGGGTTTLRPGTEYPIILEDEDQNSNSGARDDLDIFKDTSIIPTLEIGNPVTLEKANNVRFFSNSNDVALASSSIPDTNSDRLIIDSTNIGKTSPFNFEKMSFNLGVSVSSLKSTLIDTSKSNSFGTNWLNYDLQSFSRDYGINDFSDTSIELSFGTLGSDPKIIANSGQISSSGFLKLDDSVVKDILSKNGQVFVTINFDSSNNSFNVGSISKESNKQPIVMDFFSFGLVNNDDVNNSIYRFELEETSDNSSIFEGTLEYAITNQLNILDPEFIQTIRTIDDEIKFIVTDRLVDEEGISINYSDLDAVGVITTTSAKSDIRTNSGRVILDSTSFRFGQPVTFTLIDQDLNLKSDRIDTYQVINDPNSPNVDTVGKDGIILLEILIKDIRYKRCTINGVETGGLGSTGFSLVETGYDTGVFTGVFKMPSQICDKSGSKLISSAGGSLDAKYYDARDDSGEPNIFSLSGIQTKQYSTIPELSQKEITRPTLGKIHEITLSGKVSNARSGLPLIIELKHPDGTSQTFSASLVNGNYMTMFSINENSLSGNYIINLSHNGIVVGNTSFTVFSPSVPEWVKNNANWWSTGTISESEFIDGLEELINKGIIRVPSSGFLKSSEKTIPDWIKTTANWWSEDKITDDDFLLSVEYLIKIGLIRI
jgi:hypothetical protein